MALLPCLWTPGWAQAPAPTPATPEQLLEDVELLMRLERLDLALSQMRQILPHLENLRRRVIRIAQLRANAYQRNRAALLRARRAMAAGEPVSPTDEGSINRALERLQRRIAAEEKAIDQLTRQIEAALTPEQLALIETQEQRELRRQRLEALRGHTTAASFIADQIMQAKQLLPDEYQRGRQAIATDIADRVEGRESPRYDAFLARLLTLMDDMYALPAPDFARREKSLERDVVVTLELRREQDVPSTRGMVTQEEYVELLRSTRTVELLRQMIAGQDWKER